MLFRSLVPVAVLCAAALLLVPGCGSKEEVAPPEIHSGIIPVSVIMERTTREELVAELGPPRETSRDEGREILAWTNDKGYIVTFSSEGNPPAVLFFQHRIEARLSGGVVTYLDAQ
jgi:hypothetical protein